MSEPTCHYIYAGGADGGKRGTKCNRPESQHCKGSHGRLAVSDHAIDDPCVGVHHMFMRNPINGTFQATLHKSTFGVVVADGFVTEAAPIAKWAIGEPWEVLRQWLAKKGGRSLRMQERVMNI